MSTNEERDGREVRQAPDRVGDRKIAAVTLASFVITGVSLVVVWVLIEAWTPSRRAGSPPPAPAPSTIATLEQSLIRHTERGEDLRREQEASLARWGWVDRDAGIARIPIEKAIDLLAATPLPADRSVDSMQAQTKPDAGVGRGP